MVHIAEWCYQIDGYLGGAPWFVLILLATGVFLTVYLKFPQIRYFRLGWKMLFGNSANHQGDTTKFQSLTTALSGTVGTGNIAGVALAVHLGGPPALLWMMICAFLGMSIKFTEVSLAHKYRRFDGEKGTVSGGPMYYMRNGLKMPIMGAIFSFATICCCFGTGGLPQVNSMANVMNYTFGIEPIITGIVVAILATLTIIGGIKRIAKINVALAPFMSVVYITGALIVIFSNHQNILPSLKMAFNGFLGGTPAMGGFLGASVSMAFNKGLNRGLFSNEAGQGSSPIVHAAAKTQRSIDEGFVALLEPFIDTVIICFLTGMVLLSTGVWCEKVNNTFQQADLTILAENNTPLLLQSHIDGTLPMPKYTGDLEVQEGKPLSEVTFFNARSVAEEVCISMKGTPYTGIIPVKDGVIDLKTYSVTGRSLIHSANLSAYAFTKGLMGEWGKYIVAFSLLLFAFSTAISWSYYGNTAITYLLGAKYVLIYKFVFISGLFMAAVTDTTIVWAISSITIVLMTLPNLIAILLLRKEMKQMVTEYENNQG